MSEELLCLDTSVLVKFLTPEEPVRESEMAAQLVLRGLTSGRLVAPAFAWAEVGSVLRKKVRQRLLDQEQAEPLWRRFCQLPIEFIEEPRLRRRSWEIANEFGLLGLYDAAFLACTEVATASAAVSAEFWTADEVLLRHLGNHAPLYVRQLR